MVNTINVFTWNNRDLHKEFGIDLLTGEADATNLGRILTDLSEWAACRFEEWLNVKVPRGTNYNTGRPFDPSVASVLLSRGALQDFLMYCALKKSEENPLLTAVYAEPNRDCQDPFFGSKVLLLTNLSRWEEYQPLLEKAGYGFRVLSMNWLGVPATNGQAIKRM